MAEADLEMNCGLWALNFMTGRVIENGFAYDSASEEPITEYELYHILRSIGHDVRVCKGTRPDGKKMTVADAALVSESMVGDKIFLGIPGHVLVAQDGYIYDVNYPNGVPACEYPHRNKRLSCVIVIE